MSGHLGHISEVAAIQRALLELQTDFDAVVSLGGESFLVYIIVDRKISNVCHTTNAPPAAANSSCSRSAVWGSAWTKLFRLRSMARLCRWPRAVQCIVSRTSLISSIGMKPHAEDILHTLHDSMASKVVALLEKGQSALQRVLLIGGVTRNAAMLAALREKLPATEFVVLPESPWFEAWGSALLTRDEPAYSSPKIAVPTTLSHLPPLSLYSDRVQVIPAPPAQPAPDGPMVLGVDAGSTTTKAILLDPATKGVVASYYTRTKGDPVAATRECLKALVEQVGNRCIGSGQAPPVRRASSPAPTLAPSMSTMRFRLMRPAPPISIARSTRSLKSAARIPNTFTCATAFPSTTR